MRSPFSSRSSRQIWLSELWKCQHCGLSVCTPGGGGGSWFIHAPISFSRTLLSWNALLTLCKPTIEARVMWLWHWITNMTDERTFSVMRTIGWMTDTHCAYLDMPVSAENLNASWLFVFPAVLPPSFRFETSFKLHVFGFCHSLCLSLSTIVPLAPTMMLYHIDMRIPALPGEKCNLIIIKQLEGEAVCLNR